jgi:hypothetical protein
MLHHPFRQFTDLFTIDGNTYAGYIESFIACQESHSHVDDYYTDLKELEPDDQVEPEFDSDSEADEAQDVPLADFEAFSRHQRAHNNNQFDFEAELGSRELDQAYDWAVHIGRHQITADIWEQLKAENPTDQVVTANSSPENLNSGQRKLYNIVVNHYERELEDKSPPQLLLNVDGVAGSGKTFTVLKTCARLQELASGAGKENPVFRSAPTGIASYNILGKTLHSLLRLPKDEDIGPRRPSLTVVTGYLSPLPLPYYRRKVNG